MPFRRPTSKFDLAKKISHLYVNLRSEQVKHLIGYELQVSSVLIPTIVLVDPHNVKVLG